MSNLRELERAATPGPWNVYEGPRPGIDAGDFTVVVFGSDDEEAGITTCADAALIVALRNSASTLLDIAEAVGGVGATPDALRAAIRDMRRSRDASIDEAMVFSAVEAMIRALETRATLEAGAPEGVPTRDRDGLFAGEALGEA